MAETSLLTAAGHVAPDFKQGMEHLARISGVSFNHASYAHTKGVRALDRDKEHIRILLMNGSSRKSATYAGKDEFIDNGKYLLYCLQRGSSERSSLNRRLDADYRNIYPSTKVYPIMTQRLPSKRADSVRRAARRGGGCCYVFPGVYRPISVQELPFKVDLDYVDSSSGQVHKRVLLERTSPQ